MPVSSRYYSSGGSVSALNRSIKSALRQRESSEDAEMAFNYKYDLISPQEYLAHVDKRIKQKRDAGDVNSYYAWETKKIDVNRKIESEIRSSYRAKALYEISKMGNDDIGKSYKKLEMYEKLYDETMNDPYMDTQAKNNAIMSILTAYENTSTSLQNSLDREALKGQRAQIKAVKAIFSAKEDEIASEIVDARGLKDKDPLGYAVALANASIEGANIAYEYAHVLGQMDGEENAARDKLRRATQWEQSAKDASQKIDGNFSTYKDSFGNDHSVFVPSGFQVQLDPMGNASLLATDKNKIDTSGNPIYDPAPGYVRSWDGERMGLRKGNTVSSPTTDKDGNVVWEDKTVSPGIMVNDSITGIPYSADKIETKVFIDGQEVPVENGQYQGKDGRYYKVGSIKINNWAPFGGDKYQHPGGATIHKVFTDINGHEIEQYNDPKTNQISFRYLDKLDATSAAQTIENNTRLRILQNAGIIPMNRHLAPNATSLIPELNRISPLQLNPLSQRYDMTAKTKNEVLNLGKGPLNLDTPPGLDTELGKQAVMQGGPGAGGGINAVMSQGDPYMNSVLNGEIPNATPLSKNQGTNLSASDVVNGVSDVASEIGSRTVQGGLKSNVQGTLNTRNAIGKGISSGISYLGGFMGRVFASAEKAKQAKIAAETAARIAEQNRINSKAYGVMAASRPTFAIPKPRAKYNSVVNLFPNNFKNPINDYWGSLEIIRNLDKAGIKGWSNQASAYEKQYGKIPSGYAADKAFRDYYSPTSNINRAIGF